MDMYMGSLSPGSTLIYERANGRIYAREFGTSNRTIVGYDVDHSPEFHMIRQEINQVLTMCEQDSAMRELLDQLIVLYNLKKPHE
jgi:hypothetical protein